ncbi:MAG: sulfotransferase [Planctomycetota bacterium]
MSLGDFFGGRPKDSAGAARGLARSARNALREGRLDAADRDLRTALRHDPQCADAHDAVALLRLAQRRIDESVASARRAVQLDPAHVEYRLTEGQALLARLDFPAARVSFAAAVGLEPRLARAHLKLGVAAERCGDVASAESAYREAAALDVGSIHAWHRLALLLLGRGRNAQAAEAIDAALAIAPGMAELWNTAGNIARVRGASERAMACFGEAIRLEPKVALPHFNLGQTLRELGRVDEAVRAYEAALVRDPDHPESHVMICKTRKVSTAEDPHLRWIQRSLREPSKARIGESELQFALAKAHADLGNARESFVALSRANALKRKQLDWSIDDARREFDALRRKFDRAAFSRTRGVLEPSPCPIFVIGMPRSGTSLVEQILASHPEVHGAGELSKIPELVKAHPSLGVEDGVASAPATDDLLRDAANEYLDTLRDAAPEGSSLVVDKLPLNFIHLGAIASMFPSAKVVHCFRDPRDNCASILRHDFAGEVPFAYDQRELGAYYHLYRRLMSHWRSVLGPDRILDVCYERLLDRFEAGVRTILGFVGLGFDERCVRFHECERPVRTASALQVHQPLFRSSIGGWRAFESELEPLLGALGPI